MITTADHIRQVRDVAINMVDQNRINPSIQEVEDLILCNAIGTALVQWLETRDDTDFTFNGVTLTPDQLRDFMEGGYYSYAGCSCNGSNGMRKSGGLYRAVAYLAYGKLLNHQITVTAFNVNKKKTQVSTEPDTADLTINRKDALNTGQAYLNQVIEHGKSLGIIYDDCEVKNRTSVLNKFASFKHNKF